MDTSIWIAFGAVFISLLALGTSIIALWKTHFSKFSAVLTVGDCRLHIYPIKNENDRWFIPSLDTAISFTNKGAQLGKIEDLRIRVSFPKLPIPGHFEMFYAKWIVDGKMISKERFNWIESAVIEDWMPFVLLPRDTKTKHIVFESFRWDNPVIQEEMLCELEILAKNRSRWEKITEWKFSLNVEVWSELVEVGTSISTSTDQKYEIREYLNPEDLHKYTGSKDHIPKNGFKAAPSYLDFPKEKLDE